MDDIRIFVENEDAEKTYKELREKSVLGNYLDKNHQLFTMAVLIGKYVLNKKEPLKRKKGFIRRDSIENTAEMDILRCIAIEEVDDVKVISDLKEIFEICEEYANVGIKELKKWTRSKAEFEVKISEVLIDKFEENKEIYSKYEN